ncbi:hypothetical protein Salmuc_01839 [Salipiger mucosus DSM 16094]|uniref:Uncharacterized protein n=1 Tax=Salipiger mucosus DSM 16094 TaxID=1123237 RepID=S9SCW0_9RHOB|nr:hypothetical protein Salmuc_01839 [Salipiger mucosus DSM 16094]
MHDIAPYLLQNDLGGESLVEFEHEEGWDLIVVNLARAIDRHVRHQAKIDPESYDLDLIYFSQVKEKKGSLRAYVTMPDAIINAYVDFAELMSETTCEVTGRPGLLHTKMGFVKTLHPDVAAERGFKPVD